jgi:hypothetical protein
MLKTHKGSCHCGHVQFEIDSDLRHISSCDCTICVRTGALVQCVDEAHFRLLKPVESSLEDGTHGLIVYQFNTRVAKNYICAVCGIMPFRRPRTSPELWAINVRCLDGVVINDLEVQKVLGSELSVVDGPNGPL